MKEPVELRVVWLAGGLNHAPNVNNHRYSTFFAVECRGFGKIELSEFNSSLKRV